MKRQVVFLAVFAGIVLIFFGYWATSQLFYSGTSSGSESNSSQSAANLYAQTNPVFETQPSEQPISWLNSANNGTGGQKNSPSQANLTENIANNMSQDFIASYPSGGNISTSSANDLIDKYISSGQLSATTSLEFDKPIDTSKLNISQDNSKDSKQRYFANLYMTISSNIDYIKNGSLKNAIQSIIENNDNAPAQQIINNSYQIVDKLIALSVPSDLVTLHERALDTFDNIGYFYSLLANYQQDPVKLALAINYFPNIISENRSLFSDLQKASDAVN